MLKFMRERRRSVFIIMAFFAIIVVFVFWGVGPTGQNGKTSGNVAEVDGVVIPASVYENLYKRQLDYYNSIFKGNIPEGFLERLNLRQQTLDMLIEKTLMLNEAYEKGIKVTEKEVQDKILSVPVFQKNGVFDKELYFSVLQRNRLNPQEYENAIEEDLVMIKMQNDVTRGITISDEEIRSEFLRGNREISLDYVEVASSRFIRAIEIKEEDSRKYYESNKSRFMAPVKIKAFYAYMDKDATAKTIELGEDELKSYYEKNIVDFHEPKKFKARHILVGGRGDDEARGEARKRAEDLRSRLKKGEDFSKLAREHSNDPGSAKNGGDLGWFSVGTMVKPFEEALLKLKKGETSPLVETEYGFHIIRLDDLKEEKVVGFAEAKSVVKKRLLEERSENSARAAMAELHGIFKGNSSIDVIKDEAAKRGAITALTGFIPENDVQSEITRLEGLKEAAFTLNKDGVSGIISTPMRFYILKVMERVEAHPMLFDDVKGAVGEILKGERARDIAKNTAGEILNRIGKGEGLAEIAKKDGYKLGNTGFFTLTKGAIPGLEIIVTNKPGLFELKKDSPYYKEAVPHRDSFYVFKLRDAKEPLEKDFALKKEEIKERLLSQKKDDAIKKWTNALRGKAKITMYDEVL